MQSRLTTLARQLRKNMTPAERVLWRHLRGKQLKNLKFRRQQPIGNYIVDFVCFEKRLVIEIDGGHHAVDEVSDSHRTRWLNEKGYTLIRFWNNEVLTNCSGVLEKIMEYCR